MAATSKGQRWEILHSLWVIWTFTLGFFNWIAFFYIGYRTNQRKWILWGLFYSVPFSLLIFVADTSNSDSLSMNLTMPFLLVVGVVSLVHAFKARREYLVRLETLQSREPSRTATLRREVQREYGVGTQEAPLSQSDAWPQPTTLPSRNQERASAPPAESPDPPSSAGTQASTTDLNNASERELAALPGVGVIVAKRAVSLRESKGGFRSVEDFGEALNLKPHIVERVRPLVSISPAQQSERPGSSGRIVDF